MDSESESGSEDGVTSSKVLPFLFAVALLAALFLSIAVAKIRALRWLHESLAVLALSTLVGAIDAYVLPPAYRFSWAFGSEDFSSVFFNLLFPPVVFNAGFTVKHRNFMRNAGAISLYSFAGTTLSAAVTGVLLWVLGRFGGIGSADLIECLMFGALVSCTDAVATLAVLLEVNVQPLLHSIVFGESLLNDAVAIVLCSALAPYVGKDANWETALLVLREFVVTVLGSVGIGIGVGLLAAFIAARQKNWNLAPTFEIMQLFIFAYISYAAADAVDLSGVIALFICALVLSHYCWYSISDDSRKAVFQISATLDYLAEMIVYLSLGFFLFLPTHGTWNVWFVLFTFAVILFARALSVGGFSFLLNAFRKRSERIPFRYQLVIWFCGTRGIITLLLAFNMRTPNRGLFITTVFVIIFSTTAIIGLCTKPLVLHLNVRSELPGVNVRAATDSAAESGGAAAAVIAHDSRQDGPFIRCWHLADNKVFKRVFGGSNRRDGDFDDEPLIDVASGGGEEGGEMVAAARPPRRPLVAPRADTVHSMLSLTAPHRSARPHPAEDEDDDEDDSN